MGGGVREKKFRQKNWGLYKDGKIFGRVSERARSTLYIHELTSERASEREHSIVAWVSERASVKKCSNPYSSERASVILQIMISVSGRASELRVSERAWDPKLMHKTPIIGVIIHLLDFSNHGCS